MLYCGGKHQDPEEGSKPWEVRQDTTQGHSVQDKTKRVTAKCVLDVPSPESFRRAPTPWKRWHLSVWLDPVSGSPWGTALCTICNICQISSSLTIIVHVSCWVCLLLYICVFRVDHLGLDYHLSGWSSLEKTVSFPFSGHSLSIALHLGVSKDGTSEIFHIYVGMSIGVVIVQVLFRWEYC